MQYTWNPAKAASNIVDHQVTFEEAISALEDPHAWPFPDDAKGERRLVVLGWSDQARVLYVVTLDIDDDTVRIISARKATRTEARMYAEQT